MQVDAINIDPEILSGTPVFKGTRVAVKTLFDYIGTGESLKDFLQDFPSVQEKQALDVLQFAGRVVVSEKILLDENSAR
ncbi:DUF433 domain-containing protein [Segetibacter aerophilus]|uniref:Antitoxin n=1 Tax=Segetibacter aerophilus TaxID=670293 RepID=A0A512BFD7_9BACT|nr:DUF433 domain-containing protein [Segetibacter aerophilus]GEO10663.1 hypothetical protein SAE01_31590 [Segetibacter aerophilus]